MASDDIPTAEELFAQHGGGGGGGGGGLPLFALGIALAFVIYYFLGAFDNHIDHWTYWARP